MPFIFVFFFSSFSFYYYYLDWYKTQTTYTKSFWSISVFRRHTTHKPVGRYIIYIRGRKTIKSNRMRNKQNRIENIEFIRPIGKIGMLLCFALLGGVSVCVRVCRGVFAIDSAEFTYYFYFGIIIFSRKSNYGYPQLSTHTHTHAHNVSVLGFEWISAKGVGLHSIYICRSSKLELPKKILKSVWNSKQAYNFKSH